MQMEMWFNGLMVALQPNCILYLLLGTVYGIFIGALPGLGPTFAVASMIPVTFAMDPAPAIIFLTAIHASCTYGDSIASILVNIPGGTGSVATCWDGYPMARSGKAGFAMGISAGASLLGGLVGWGSLVLIAPFLMSIALEIGPAEYTMLAVLALSLMSVAAQGDTIKGLLLGGIGLLLSFIGTDPIGGFSRYTFGWSYLEDGIGIVPVVLGFFAVSQAISLGVEGDAATANLVSWTKKDSVWKGVWEVFSFRRGPTILRSAIIGIFIGILPALGLSAAGISSYFVEKKTSKEPETFGKGNVNGLLGPEMTKNACVIGDLIPTFTLGIPGSVTTALFLGALLIHGIAPGVGFFKEGAGVFPYAVFMGILLAQIAFFLIGCTTARYWAKVVFLSNRLLAPFIVILCLLGAYSTSNDMNDVYATIFFGVVGYLLERWRWPVVCMVLGLILGRILDANFNRSLLISEGRYSIFVTEPISLGLFIVTITFLAWPWISPLIKRLPDYLRPGKD